MQFVKNGEVVGSVVVDEVEDSIENGVEEGVEQRVERRSCFYRNALCGKTFNVKLRKRAIGYKN